VTNGYVSPEARAEVFRHTDAANVDLKAFSEWFYFKLTAAHLWLTCPELHSAVRVSIGGSNKIISEHNHRFLCGCPLTAV